MKNVWAILVWGVLIFAIGTYLDKVREMLMGGGDPVNTAILQFGVGLALVVAVVLAGRWVKRWSGGMRVGDWWIAGAAAWLLEGGYVWKLEPRRMLDLLIHDTFFNIFFPHAAIGVAVIFGMIGMVYLSFSSVMGRKMNRVMGFLHFWISLAALYVVLWMQSYKYVNVTNIAEGMWGLEMRTFQSWQRSQIVGWAYAGLTALFVAAQLMFVGNLLAGLLFARKRRQRAADGRFR